MANFTKIFGLAGALVVFAGLASAQSTCTAVPPATNIIRAEGTTELVSTLTLNCTAGTGGTASLQVFLSPALPITSKLFSSGSTEATATVGATTVAGTVSGSSLFFSSITIPATAFTLTVTNVRVNATSVAVGSGIPPSISATAFISGSVTPVALSFPNVAFVQTGLKTSTVSKAFTAGVFPNGTTTGTAVNFVTCNGYTPNSGAFLAVTVGENFPSAFKTAADEASQTVPSPGGSNTISSGTRLAVSFSNVPTNVTLYVPVAAISSTAGGAQIRLTNAAAGATFASVSASTSSSLGGFGGVAAVSLTGGAGTSTFEVTVDDPNALDNFNIPVYIVAAANTVVPSSTPVGVSVSLSPIGSTTVIPNFVVGSATTALTGPTFNICSTSLLFPFVTNQVGFDTGLAISNTSSDPFGTKAQAGTCTLNFYGSGAPSPANIVSPNVPTGTTYATVLSSSAPGFQGYVIAQCNFQFAHGFAFITNGVGITGGLSQGYLAGIIPDPTQITRAANPIGAVTTAGSGETLGN